MSQFETEPTVLSSRERIGPGHALRAQTPRAAHAEWQYRAGAVVPLVPLVLKGSIL